MIDSLASISYGLCLLLGFVALLLHTRASRILGVISIGGMAISMAIWCFDFSRSPSLKEIIHLCLFSISGVIAIVRKAPGMPPGHCTTCGYNLTGNVSGKCSECGAPVPTP